QIIIMAGSMPHTDGSRVVNRALLYGPDGELAGTQDKVHLMPLEHGWGFSPGSEFRVFATPLGRLAMPVCMDATYFETFRILANLGAEIVMVPIANAEPYNEWLALRGIWPRVQESLVFGIKSALVGNLLGFELTGKAGIFAPLPLTPGGDGVLAEAASPDKEDFVRAVLDLEALSKLRANHPYLGDENPELLRKNFPQYRM
ncbi:MAG: nitrilase-related carbon-nitrogen hydrolase, partial [Bacillota bacterium]|nr:nitrilase-related carbon-nitrogen hydrolase [Bacillota bacterium]